MAWLVSEARVLASAEVAPGRRERTRGLLGRDSLEGALVLDPCRWVHTIGMRFAIDVAYVDGDGVVVKTVQMRRHRVGVPVFGARYVVEAAAGAFARWGLRVGDTIEIRSDDRPAPPAPPADPAPGTKPATDVLPPPSESTRERDGGDSRRLAVLATSR